MSAQRSLRFPGWSIAETGAGAASSGSNSGGGAVAAAGEDGTFTGLVVFLKVALDKLQFAKHIKALQKTSGLGDDSFSEGPVTTSPSSLPSTSFLVNPRTLLGRSTSALSSR